MNRLFAPPALVLAAVLTLAACQPGGSSGNADADAPGEAGSSCGVFLRGQDARAVAEGPDAEAFCADAQKGWSSGGSFWSLQEQPASGELSTVCVVTKNGKATVRVDDSGSQAAGTSACSSLVSAGWTEDLSALRAIQEQAQADKAAAAGEAAAVDALSQLEHAVSQVNAATIRAQARADDVTAAADEVATDVADVQRSLDDAKAATDPVDVCMAVGDVGSNASWVGTQVAGVGGDVDVFAAAVDDLHSAFGLMMATLEDALGAPGADDSQAVADATPLTGGVDIDPIVAQVNAAIDVANQHLTDAYALAPQAAALGDCGDVTPDDATPLEHVHASSDYVPDGD